MRRVLPTLILTLVIAALLAHAEEIPLGAPLNADRATVIVVCVDTGEYGTGWWVDYNHIVTASHVVAWGSCQQVMVLRGGWQSPATILVATDREHGDVAVLEVANPLPRHPTLPLCSDEPEPPFLVYIIGYPSELYQLTRSLERLSELPRIHTATISWYDPARRIYEIGRTDTGNSGGPVITANGCVVAIVSFALRGGASELFFGSSVYWVKQALREAGVRWQEMQAATLDIGEVAVSAQQAVNASAEMLAQVKSSQAGLQEKVEEIYDFLYSLYIRDPVFFVVLAVLPELALLALAALVKR